MKKRKSVSEGEEEEGGGERRVHEEEGKMRPLKKMKFVRRGMSEEAAGNVASDDNAAALEGDGEQPAGRMVRSLC